MHFEPRFAHEMAHLSLGKREGTEGGRGEGGFTGEGMNDNMGKESGRMEAEGRRGRELTGRLGVGGVFGQQEGVSISEGDYRK